MNRPRKPLEGCKHCGEEIDGRIHPRTGLGRCDPQLSGLPYGYNAEAVGEPCERPCMGVRFPVPDRSQR